MKLIEKPGHCNTLNYIRLRIYLDAQIAAAGEPGTSGVMFTRGVVTDDPIAARKFQVVILEREEAIAKLWTDELPLDTKEC